MGLGVVCSDMAQQTTLADIEPESDAESDTVDRVDTDALPTNERVLLIQGISGVMHTPTIVEGETSSTGKTISVTDKHKDSKTYRLDAEKLFTGGLEIRRATTFELYTPERLQQKQHANYGPGPQSGANEISDTDDLPDPTHRPADGE